MADNNNNNNNGATLLPDPKKRNILITSALPYVNNVPHLGNIIGCVLSADVFARYCRLRGYNTLYICGTDEYGTATETKALMEKTTPRAICDKYHKIHAEIYDWFNISFDKFGRTSTPEQTLVTQDIFKKLHKNGYTTRDHIEQLYCPTCKLFLADRFVEGTCPHCGYEDARGDQCDKCQKLLNPTELKNPRCKVSGTTPVVRSSEHIFLDLPKLYEPLHEWFAKAAEKGEWSTNSRQITGSWIKPDGLKPRCITRDLKWGTPVPLEGFEDKVFYVWFDACIGYVSITATYTPEWERWWKNPNDVSLYQFMGKDNVPFHTVIFPGSLLGTGDNYTMLHHVSTTEFLNYENTKFSKSRGIGVFGDQAKETGIPSECWRYYLLVNRPESADSNFSWDDFSLKVKTELAANLGNFVNRSLKFIVQFFEGKIPEKGEFTEEDKAFIKSVDEKIKSYVEHLEKVKIKDALHKVMEISAEGNKYAQDNKPWELFKTNKDRCGTVVYLTSNLVKTLAALIEPYMPTLTDKILTQLKSPHDQIKDTFEFLLVSGHAIGDPQPLVANIDPVKLNECKAKFSGEDSKAPAFPAEIRVGKIVDAQFHPQADHLYILKVDMGKETRSIVSGLRAAYRDRDLLLGKKVVVLCNIKESKLKGVPSQGMLLVADFEGGKQVEVLTVGESANVPLGTLVLPAGHKLQESKQKYTVPDFQKLDLQVIDGVAVLDGNKKLVADAAEVIPAGSIRSAKIK